MTTPDELAPKRTFLPLLISLTALFLLYPLIIELGYVRFFRVCFLAVMAGAVYSLSERRHRLVAALWLAVPTGVAQIAALATPSRAVLVVSVLLSLTFTSYVLAVVIRAVLRRGKVTGDKLVGAICVYLLLGLAWAMVHGLIAILQPDAFSTPVDMATLSRLGSEAEYGFVYYSFVTLTTLGFGDITPISPTARAAAWIEAVTGQLYVAILVARLVALQILHGTDTEGPA